MKVDIANNNYHQNVNGSILAANECSDGKMNRRQNSGYGITNVSAKDVSFKGGNYSKRFWLMLRQLSNYMKEPSEMTNAIIAAVGTGAIAPIAIMCSPGKKVNTPEEQKIEREKKTFQALRQPVSAALAFGFQVPTTIGIAKLFNNMAYEKQVKMFDDEILGTLIPDTKYLKKQAKKVLNESASEELKAKWGDELAKIANTDAMKKELMEQLSKDYEEIGIKIEQGELRKAADNPKTLRKFLAEKMAKYKHDVLVDNKVQELINKGFPMDTIKDMDLVTEDYLNLAKLRNKAEFEKLSSEANLSFFDKFIKSMGFSNKKLKKLADAENQKAKELGLEILKTEEPNVFSDATAKLRKYVENVDKKSQKLYGNKIFWLTLATNLFMVAISCIALNWLHPKFARFVDNIKDRKHQKQDEQNGAKVEVRA